MNIHDATGELITNWWHCKLVTAGKWTATQLNVMAVTRLVSLSAVSSTQRLNLLSYCPPPMHIRSTCGINHPVWMTTEICMFYIMLTTPFLYSVAYPLCSTYLSRAQAIWGEKNYKTMHASLRYVSDIRDGNAVAVFAKSYGLCYGSDRNHCYHGHQPSVLTNWATRTPTQVWGGGGQQSWIIINLWSYFLTVVDKV